MRVYCIDKSQLSLFANVTSKDSDYVQIVQNLWETGQSRPEWCFVIEDAGQIVGRVGFWSSPENLKVIRVFGLHLPCIREDCFQVGTQLLEESLQQMSTQGICKIESQLDSERINCFNTYMQVYETVGFQMIQDKKRFILAENNFKPITQTRLNYKSYANVQSEVFIDAIESVTCGTLDREDQLSIQNHGPKEAANQYFELLKEIDDHPDWWKLAYIDDSLVGLIVPQQFRTELGAINYIGVIPEQRGNGFSLELLSKGTDILINSGIKKVIADIDSNNFPLESALKNVGYHQESTLAVFEMVLSQSC